MARRRVIRIEPRADGGASLTGPGLKRQLSPAAVESLHDDPEHPPPLRITRDDPVLLEIGSVELGRVAWERALAPSMRATRLSEAPARVVGAPLTLPVRGVSIGRKSAKARLSEAADGADRDLIVVRRLGAASAASWRPSDKWPSGDIVEVEWRPTPDTGPVRSTASLRPFTLGWLERVAFVAQARLVVLVCERGDAGDARAVASLLADRGGPAVLVTTAGSELVRFYRAVLAGEGLDRATRARLGALVAGQGRAAALTIAPIVSRLDVHRLVTMGSLSIGLAVGLALEPARAWAAKRSVRVAETVARGINRDRTPAERSHPHHVGENVGDRYVNVSVRGADGKPAGTPPAVGRRFRVQVAVGPFDEALGTAREAALRQELLFPEAEVDGRWLEVALVELDCTLHGAPLQTFWLPRTGSSQAVTFAVSSPRAGPARLRVVVYADHTALMSLLVTVAVGRDTEYEGRRPWKTEVEYARGADADAMLRAPARTLSIVANDLDGQPHFVVNAADAFFTRPNAALGDAVQEVRDALEAVSTPDPGDPRIIPEKWPYGFADDNTGTHEQLEAALLRLAPAGWQLYDAVVPGDDREAVERALRDDGEIEVAHLVLEKVIPWAAMYNRFYDTERTEKDGRPVRFAACTAALRGGRLDTSAQCRHVEECLLHDRNRETGDAVYMDETVACPLRFWGFRHVIEVPPQQGRGKAPPPVRDEVHAAQRPRVTVGMHGGLPLCVSHREALEALVTQADVDSELSGPVFARDGLLDLLNAEQPDLVYLYCHAEGGEGTGIARPALRLRHPDQGAKEGRVHAEHLAGKAWQHAPLVVLNGCRTAAYRPDALSPFIDRLTADRHASGVLGTEVAVWEQLAGEVGLRFVAAFVTGAAAGEALRDVRRELLCKGNPLGLAYTLYAVAELRLLRGAADA